MFAPELKQEAVAHCTIVDLRQCLYLGAVSPCQCGLCGERNARVHHCSGRRRLRWLCVIVWGLYGRYREATR